MLSVYLYLHFRQSFISVAVCISKYRHWKGKGFLAEYSPKEEDSDRNGLPLDLSTFKGHCTTFADEQRKRANDGIGKLIYRRLMIDPIKYYLAIMKNAPPFCSFIKSCTFVLRWVVHQCKSRKYLEIRTVANSLPRSQTFRINILFLVDYKIIPKILIKSYG